ncbi:DUF5999 family protein [Streptomyces sp. enrichment culture]|uniref:DUF5999 family protein n=1 Tax=Streptomyces sp. enrichment culture TaxID=1795815 RepID=UPI003F55ABB9
MCRHSPPCPTAEAANQEAARTIALHPEQGWSVKCAIWFGWTIAELTATGRF